VLEIIGSGLGRTGTFSTKLALEKLGYPCHHMAEVFMHPETIPLWIDAHQGRPAWDAIFKGYRAQVDLPGSQYFASLAAHYPQAKVLHTVRDPDKWFDSTQATIFAPDSPSNRPEMAAFFGPIADFHGGEDRFDRARMIAFFHRHTEVVKAAIPPERLLIWNVAEGWEPLCAFLGLPVPDEPIPHENTTEQFRARQAERAAAAGAH
jgi:hypothetical protein